MYGITLSQQTHFAFYIVQIATLIVLVAVCIIALFNDIGDQSYWKVILSTCLTYMLPKPKLATKKIEGDRK